MAKNKHAMSENRKTPNRKKEKWKGREGMGETIGWTPDGGRANPRA
jgi:hypothetical protein